jgi:hypothetical protein
MDSGDFPPRIKRRGITLITNFHLMPSLRITGAYPPYAVMPWTGENLPLPLPLRFVDLATIESDKTFTAINSVSSKNT